MNRLSETALRLTDRLPPASRFLAQRQLHHPIFQKYGWGIAASVFAQTELFALETSERLQAITRHEIRSGIQVVAGYSVPLGPPVWLWLHSGAWVLLLLCILLPLSGPAPPPPRRRRSRREAKQPGTWPPGLSMRVFS